MSAITKNVGWAIPSFLTRISSVLYKLQVMADQQLCQSSERILKLFLDESVTNKAISLQLWFNRFGKLQFRLSTAPSRRDNRRTTSNRDEGPAPVANRPPQKAPAQPQPTVTTRSTTAANKKRKTAPTISPVVESVRSAHEPSPEIPRCASQRSQHALSFLDPNERDKQPSDEECSDEETIPALQESESAYTSPFLTKTGFRHSHPHKSPRPMFQTFISR